MRIKRIGGALNSLERSKESTNTTAVITHDNDGRSHAPGATQAQMQREGEANKGFFIAISRFLNIGLIHHFPLVHLDVFSSLEMY